MKRWRETGEITPIRAEQSGTLSKNEAKFGAGNAIDKDFHTASWSAHVHDGEAWIKITLDQERCVEKVMNYNRDTHAPRETWTCTQIDCSSCVGGQCESLDLTVSIEGAATDQSSVLSCRYGNTVTLATNYVGSEIKVHEIAIIDKHGNC